MQGQELNLEDNNSWLCRHARSTGEPAPPTRLRLDQTQAWPQLSLKSSPRRWLKCPDCGTTWRVWPASRIAKPSVEWNATDQPPNTYPYRRAPILDIDKFIDIVKSHLPTIRVLQHLNAHPSDDEGLWWFQLPDVKNDIQFESPTGMCPFLVEHSGMKSSVEARNATSVEEAAHMAIDYLRRTVYRGPAGE